MNIDAVNNHGANQVNDMEHITYGKPASAGSRMTTEKMGFSLDITGKVRENAAYGKEELKSADEIAQIAGMTDVSLQRDYMAVMSNSMSDEDYAELMKDGVNPAKVPTGEAVTNLDRIKIRMAEAGTTIAGYNDDLSEEEVKAVLGNTINAGAVISGALKVSDLPVTDDNVSGIRQSVMMAQNLKPVSDEAMAYMITEDLAPTVENLYKAEYSAANAAKPDGGIHFNGAATYAGSAYTESSWDDLKDQAMEVIEEAGLTADEETVNDAKWIAMHEIPLTKDTLDAYRQIKDITVPAEPADLFAAMTVAIEEGRSPKEADLTLTKSLYTQASEIVETFKNMQAPEDITKHRQLEEVRLVMTKEANLTLLRKGIDIETQPLEKLVDALKEAEREFWAPVLTDNKTASDLSEAEGAELDEKIDLYRQTRRVIEEIPHMPLRAVAERVIPEGQRTADAVLGPVNIGLPDDLKAGREASLGDLSLGRLAETGRSLASVYERAGVTYEALMTAPRADMGDSIRKAFANVDDILSDLDIDVNEVNRKAVRTLGYAGMAIDRDNIDTVRSATLSVERVMSLMTPAKTLSMIREGHNPLNENIFELERSLSEETFEDTGEKYSRFLFRLEKNGEITGEEKQAFIGIYRLFNKIEKQDGKVIGNVLSSGEELTLENMLKASRSNRHMNNEYVIDDDFGTLEKLVERGDSITSQIESAFAQLIAPEPDRDYIVEKQREIRAAGKVIKDAEEILTSLSEPITAENILAVNALTGGMGPGYKKLFSGQGSFEEDGEDKERVLTEEDARELAEDFGDRESALAAYERFLEKAGRIAGQQALSSETYEDVRTCSMIYKQVGFAASLAGRESYEVPVQLDEGWTSIHLTIVHAKDENGKVRASFESEAYGSVEATFSLRPAGIDGFIVSNSRAGVDNLKRIDDKIRESFTKENMDTANLSYVFSNNRNSEYLPGSDAGTVSNSSLYRIAKAFIGAVQKV